jgi:26S proteasome regulatory subunit T3
MLNNKVSSSFQKLQRQLEFLEVQEEYIKDEQKNLKKEYLHAQEEVKRIQSVPLVIGQFLEAVDQNTGIVGSTTGMRFRYFQERISSCKNPMNAH